MHILYMVWYAVYTCDPCTGHSTCTYVCISGITQIATTSCANSISTTAQLSLHQDVLLVLLVLIPASQLPASYASTLWVDTTLCVTDAAMDTRYAIGIRIPMHMEVWNSWRYYIPPLHGGTEHPYPTHSLPESVDMLVCWVTLSLYILLPSVYPYAYYGMTSTMLHSLASHTHTPVLSQRAYIRPPLSCSTYSRFLLSVYVTTYLYTYLCMCTCVLYSTRSIPYMVFCHLLHVSTCAQTSYPYTPVHRQVYHIIWCIATQYLVTIETVC